MTKDLNHLETRYNTRQYKELYSTMWCEQTLFPDTLFYTVISVPTTDFTGGARWEWLGGLVRVVQPDEPVFADRQGSISLTTIPSPSLAVIFGTATLQFELLFISDVETWNLFFCPSFVHPTSFSPCAEGDIGYLCALRHTSLTSHLLQKKKKKLPYLPTVIPGKTEIGKHAELYVS